MKKGGLICKIIIFTLIIVNVLSQDFYELLEITRDTSLKDMKKNYRRLSKKYHPDKNPGKYILKEYLLSKLNHELL